MKYGECHYSKPFEKDESEIKVTEVEWKAVPISKTSKRVRNNFKFFKIKEKR